ncbi:hypothetical protein ERO13_A06G050500v2 [Gossypium hirsutum]|nr:hypothetical protein ERO13_A06G050500v2 [Gossypium hirsutum]
MSHLPPQMSHKNIIIIYSTFGWGIGMHSPYSAGPPPNGRLVGRNAITSRIHSVPITPLAVIGIPHAERRLGIPYRFLFSIPYSALIDFCFFFRRYCTSLAAAILMQNLSRISMLREMNITNLDRVPKNIGIP